MTVHCVSLKPTIGPSYNSDRVTNSDECTLDDSLTNNINKTLNYMEHNTRQNEPETNVWK